MLRHCLILFAVLAGAVGAQAANVLLVISGSTPGTQESARRTAFQGWGHTVTTIQDSNSQANFDTAVAAADVVYVSGTIQPWDLLYKLRDASCGVISEVPDLDTEFGFCTNDGYTDSGTDVVFSLDNTHPVTTGLPSGTVSFFDTNQGSSQNGNTVAGGMATLGLGSFGMMSLGVMESNAALANTYNSNSTASGRRVRMPWNNVTWSELNANGEQLVQQAIDWAASGSAGGGSTGNVLLVTAGSSPTSEESARQTQFEGWGFTVTTIEDGASQSAFDTALALTDVVYVPQSADAASLAYKLRTATIGVVHEGVNSWDDNMGWTTSTGQNTNVCSTMTVTDNSHPISEHFSTGTVTIFNSSTASYGSQVVATLAGGADVLATNRCVNSGNANLLVMEIGATLANTYDNNSAASGRRVRLPMGGGYTFAWSNVSSGGLTMVRSALEWAASDGLLLHWKLDDASGTTAEDSSGNGNDGTLTGSQGWTTGKDGGAHTFDYTDGTDDYFQAPANTDLNDVNKGDYTLMAYVKPNSLPPGTGSNNTASYAILVKTGYHVGLTYNNAGQFQFDHWLAGNSWSGTGTWDDTYAPGQWHHVAGVVSRTNGTVKIYVDGELKYTDTFTAGTAGADLGSNRWHVGIAGPGFSNWRWAADADIDDARIYGRALTDGEIAAFKDLGLIAHYKLDEGSGTTVADDSGNGNDAAFDDGTPVWTSGVRGGALEFGGTSDVETLANFDPPAVGSVAFWYRSNAIPTGNERFIGATGNWEIRTGVTGSIACDLAGPSGGSFQTSDNALSPGRWRHLVAIYNANDDTHRLYLDGELISSGAFTCTDESPNPLTLGSRTGSTERFNGALDDVRIYNYELSEAEIAELYGLIGHWKFDETSGSTATDSSGFGVDLAASGTPTWGVEGVRAEAVDVGESTLFVSPATAYESIDEAVSVACWFKPELDLSDVPTNNAWLVRCDDSSAQTGFGMKIVPSIGGVRFQKGNGSSRVNVTTVDESFSASDWRHLIGVYDGSELRIYLDGQLLETVNDPSGLAAEVQPLQVGQNLSAAFDDIRVYNRAISDREIAEIYGLVGRWKLDETSGSVATDSSGAGRHGTYLGSPTLGEVGPSNGDMAATFDGADDCVLLPTIDDTFGDGVTIAAWAKPSAANNYAKLLQLSAGTSNEIDLGRSGTSNDLRGTTGGGSALVVSNGLHADVWRHYAMSIRSNGDITIYRNGASIGTGSVTTPTVANRTTNWIGASNWGADGLFEGQMFDVRLYNRPIMDDEAQALYLGHAVTGPRIVKWVEVANP